MAARRRDDLPVWRVRRVTVTVETDRAETCQRTGRQRVAVPIRANCVFSAAGRERHNRREQRCPKKDQSVHGMLLSEIFSASAGSVQCERDEDFYGMTRNGHCMRMVQKK